ncbi:pentapeptide repeat-containing protein [Streptomyces sp. NPDC058297]|uniref:pentapeptide repeat-containing protein n=1 Tax=Streptomyces sp. NPDC058297 TaxID=3346433 RepID=UPI0036E5FD0D
MLAQTNSLQGDQRTTARIDAIKTALTVGAGTGGAAALLLALRRQWLSEHTHIRQEAADTIAEFDATERRITELYTAAAGQLGSDSPSVRLAGLYALERLAQDHPTHRQTIVNVLCSYLRMPLLRITKLELLARAQGEAPTSAERRAAKLAYQETRAQREQELVVRGAVIEILSRHLRTAPVDGAFHQDAPQQYWPGIDLDLSGAELYGVDFSTCRIRVANFAGVTFKDGANFAFAEFTDHVYFHRAVFYDTVTFRGAWFGLRAVFMSTTFQQRADFHATTFTGMVIFHNVAAHGKLTLKNARASTVFSTNWGTQREWAQGWAERPLHAGEDMPDVSRRTRSAVPVYPIAEWHRVVRTRGGP